MTPAAFDRTHSPEDDYVAWLCFRHRNDNQQPYLAVCDSDSPGAFKVYRHTADDGSLQVDYDALLKDRNLMWSVMSGGFVDEYVSGLDWSSEATDREKTLVIGNIRAFVYNFHRVIVAGYRCMLTKDFPASTRAALSDEFDRLAGQQSAGVIDGQWDEVAP
jgi:hypothetical protein